MVYKESLPSSNQGIQGARIIIFLTLIGLNCIIFTPQNMTRLFTLKLSY